MQYAKLRLAVRVGVAAPVFMALCIGGGVAWSASPGQRVAAQAGAGAPAKPKPAKPAKSQTLQTVMVTGSRIPRPALTSSAELHSITQQEIQLQGVTNVDQLLMNEPSAQVLSSSNSDTEDGFSTVGLRGFGPNRTLVLIDGSRVVPGDPAAFNTGNSDVNGTNLNFIPTPLVQRVDVLTGGASAVYGSDAIAGVVNFVMKQNFSGLTFDGQWSGSTHGDGGSYNPTLIWGANSHDGKDNITLYAGFTKQNPVMAADRGFSACPFEVNAAGTGRQCFGSSAIPAGNFISLDRPVGDNSVMVDPNGSRTFVPQDGSSFNFDKFSYLVRPDSRHQYGGFAHANLNRHVHLYGSVMYMRDRNQMEPAPSPLFFNEFNINCANPLLSDQQQAYLCPNPGQTQAHTEIGRRLLELGPRYVKLRNTEWRAQFGVKGQIVDGWSYNASVQRSLNSTDEDYLNYYSKQRVAQALQAVAGPGGSPVCIDASGGCVPLDLFQYLAITPAQADFIRASGAEHGTTSEEVGTVSVNGDLGQYNVHSPFAADGVQFAGGIEYRREGLHFLPDAGIQSGDTTDEGGAIPAVDGSFNVRDAFAEFQVPVVEDRPGIRDLSFDVAYRLSKYRVATRSNGFETHAYGLNVRYAPDRDVALRASWNRSVRAPDIQELFFPATVTPLIVGDPCSGASPAASEAACANTGVTAAQYGNIPQCPALECNVRVGGNLDLKPERSITRQLGLVLTPHFVPGFTGTVDYHDIVLTDAISAIPPLSVLGACLDGGEFCDEIQRGPNGNLFGDPSESFINATDLNIGFLRSRGFDLSLNYDRYLSDLGLGDNGRVLFSMISTYVSDFQEKTTPTSPEFDCAGLYGPVCGVPSPRWRSRARVSWENPMGDVPGLMLSLQWRYIGHVHLDANSGNPELNPTDAPFDALDNKLPAVSYFDVSGTYALPLRHQDVTLRFGVNNLADRDPPVVDFAEIPTSIIFSAPNNTFSSLYDILGRVYFVGVDASIR